MFKKVDSEDFDHRMLTLDISRGKEYLGKNAMIGVSMAILRLEANIRKIPLWKLISEKSRFSAAKPSLFMNALNGGVRTDFGLPFGEYLFVISGETLSSENDAALALFEKVRRKLDEKNISYYFGEEGGFAPRLSSIDKPFEILDECVAGDPNIFIGIDASASDFYKKESDKYEIMGKTISRGDLLLLYKGLVEKFNIRSIEDPFAALDLKGFEETMRWIGDSSIIVADELTVTDPLLINKYGLRALASGVLIKPNQIGTMYETFEAIREARKFGWKVIVSHCLGETTDTFISDLAVGVGAYGIKAGAHTEPERRAKYDRLLVIEKEMAEIEEEERIRKEEEKKERRKLPYY
jgi:enolase